MVNVCLKSTMFGHVFCLNIWLGDERRLLFFVFLIQAGVTMRNKDIISSMALCSVVV